MQAASSGFIDTLRFGTYIIAAQVTMYSDGVPTSVVLPVSDGQFTIDRNSEFRRTGQVTIEVLPTVPVETVIVNGAAQNLLPLTPQALLAPFGNEISIEITVIGPGGVAGANGWCPLGIYQIATTTVQDTGDDLTMTLNLYDRSWAIAQRQLLTTYTVPAAQGDLQSETEALIATVWGTAPPWTYSITPSTYSVPAGSYSQGQDPWQALLDMYQSAGYELYFDVNGNIVGQPVPNPSFSAVVWNFTENEVGADGDYNNPIGGSPYSTPIDTTVTMTRDGISNDFYVSATGPNNASGSNPVQSEAADTNPLSPTYVYGPMGDIPSFISDGLITSAAQALAEAQYDLNVSIAQAWTLAVDTPPNPLFDIDDVCTVTRARLNLNATQFVIDTIQTEIRYDAQTTVSGRVIT